MSARRHNRASCPRGIGPGVLARHARSLLRSETGTAAIEFAVVLPLFVLGVVGIFGIGWAMNGVMAVRHALDETSRQLLLTPTLTQAEMQKKIDADISYLGNSKVTVQLTYDSPSGDFTLVHAKALYPFDIPIPVLNMVPLEYQASIAVPIKTN